MFEEINQPFLRPAADSELPQQLRKRIKGRLPK